MRKYSIILLALIGMSIMTSAQKGNVKIFSEIKDIHVYLDEIFQGTDIVTIDSVNSGSHYLKVLKDSVIIYSELLTIEENKITTILIKSTVEVKEKLLESKTDEIQEYKSKKLDVILSQNYVTQTKGVSSSYYFPGYYITTGTGYYNSVSTSETYTDWKIIQGGNKEISEIEFAKLTGDKETEENYNKKQKDYQKRLKASNKKTAIGVIIAIPSIIITGIIFADILGSEPFLNMSTNTESTIGAVGLLGSIVGYKLAMSNPPVFYQGHFTTVKHANEEAYKYNQALKKQLGLPENFEFNQ